MIKAIETIVLVLFLAAIMYVTTQWGIPGAVVVFGIGTVLYALSQNYLKAWKHRAALANAAVQIDNSYLYSEEEEDPTVRRRAQAEAQLLRRSGNKEFLKGNIKVHAMYFRQNEDREEMVEIQEEDKDIRSFLVLCSDYARFLEMVQEHQDAVEADHHIKIAKEDGRWYLDNALNQY